MIMKKHKNFTVLGKPFLSLGGQTHNSSGYDAENGMDISFRSVKEMGGNTIAIPVSWDIFEVSEGSFNTCHVTAMIETARKQDLHLVLLWFGSWKNGTMEYTPDWVKQDTERFPRVTCKDESLTTALSPHCTETLETEKRTFCKLVETVRDFDRDVGTVIAIQVENEAGALGGTRRDFGKHGEQDFQSEVPEELIEYASANPDSELHCSWKKAGKQNHGSWQAVFSAFGAEACSAWYLARYIDSLTAAGKEYYDLFMYTNVWLGGGFQTSFDLPGLEYPCGGAVPKTLPIWYIACNALDAIAPDIYVNETTNFLKLQKTYANPKSGWPLYVPESHYRPLNASLMFNAIANEGAIGYHIFGVESCLDESGEVTQNAQIMKRSMNMLSSVSSLILRHQTDGRMHGIFQLVGQASQYLPLNHFKCWISYDRQSSIDTGWLASDHWHKHSDMLENITNSLDEEGGRGLLFEVSDTEFFLVGHKLRLFFTPYEPLDGSIPANWLNPLLRSHSTEYLTVEEGSFSGDEFIPARRRSGDELRHGIWTHADCGVIRITIKE